MYLFLFLPLFIALIIVVFIMDVFGLN